MPCFDDRADLLAEVDRLTGELDATRAARQEWCSRLTAERDEAIAVAASARRIVDQATAQRDRLYGHVNDIAAHATPYGDIPDEPGWVGTYLLSAGALHRALGTIGYTTPSCQAETERDEAREQLRAMRRRVLDLAERLIENHNNSLDEESPNSLAFLIRAAVDGEPAPEQTEGDVRLCPECGNKRCPGAAGNACTGSNEPGQPGSLYEHVCACKPPAHYRGISRCVHNERNQPAEPPSGPVPCERRPG